MESFIFFHPKDDHTGSTKVLADTIEREYINKKVFCVATDNNSKGFLSDNKNIKIIRIHCPLINGKRIKYLSTFIYYIHAMYIALFYGSRYNVFYINTIMPFYATVAGSILRKKIIYHIHEKFQKKTLITKIAEHIFCNIPSTAYFVSQYTKDQYVMNKKSTAIIKYNSLSSAFLKNIHLTPVKDRKLNQIIMISSLSPAKGILTFVQLAQLMNHYRFSLIISSDVKSINDFFGEDIPSNLKLIPAQSNIHPFLQNSDLLLNLSIPELWIETFGLTILEAMAYGIPAIVPNMGGPTELVKDEYNGYCVNVTDLSDISQKITHILTPSNYHSFAQNALLQPKKFTY